MTQIRIIEHNDWEGETFSYVLEVSKEISTEIQRILKKEDPDGDTWEIELDTRYDNETVEMLNKHVNNGYMDYIAFYEITKGSKIHIGLFYKASGLNKL